MNASELARKILYWENLRREADEVAEVIEAAVLEGGETVTVGNARASYSAGRKKYDYQGAAIEWGADEHTIEAHTSTKTVTTTDWRQVCFDTKSASSDIPFTKSDPKVTMKLLRPGAQDPDGHV